MTGSKHLATLLAVWASALPLVAAAEDALPPGTFLIPGTNTTLKLNGHVEVDMTFDLNGRTSDINNNDWASFVPVQPFDAASGVPPKSKQFYLTSRASRLGLTTTTPTALGNLVARLEADFNAPNDFQGELSTNGTAFRVRHAYGEITGLLVGQTWSTFLDLGSIPDTVDFNPGGALALTRQPMVRYTLNRGDASFAFALENSRSLSFNGDFDSLPDAIANFTYRGPWGHVSLRGVTHEYHTPVSALHPDTEHSARAWGAGLGASFKFANETLVASVQGGDGIGRYLFNALLQGAVDTDTEIGLWRAYAYHVGLTHSWSPKLRSNIIWTQTFFAANPMLEAAHRAVAGTSNDLIPNRRVDQLYLNTFWNFAKNAEFGFECAYGLRKTFRTEVGSQFRVNALARFTLY